MNWSTVHIRSINKLLTYKHIYKIKNWHNEAVSMSACNTTHELAAAWPLHWPWLWRSLWLNLEIQPSWKRHFSTSMAKMKLRPLSCQIIGTYKLDSSVIPSAHILFSVNSQQSMNLESAIRKTVQWNKKKLNYCIELYIGVGHGAWGMDKRRYCLLLLFFWRSFVPAAVGVHAG